MLYASLLYPSTSTPTVDPGATGMFLFLLTIFIPWFYDYSYKSLLISVICGLLAFYTKPYTCLGLLIMPSYLFFFSSKKNSMVYAGMTAGLTGISVILINQIFPAYFDNCFFASLNTAQAWSSIERLYLQIHLYSAIYLWTFLLIGAFALKHLLSFFTSKENIQLNEIQLILYAAFCSAFVLYFSLGRHSGALLWYFFQLLSPFLLITAAWLFNRQSFWPLILPLLLLNLLTITADDNFQYFNKKSKEWLEIAFLTVQNHRILCSPLISPLIVEFNKEIFDNGQSEYFLPGNERKGIFGLLMKKDDRVITQELQFFQNIRNLVQDKKFDVIILQPRLLPLGIGDNIREYYKFEGEISLFAPQDRKSYDLSIWIPK